MIPYIVGLIEARDPYLVLGLLIVGLLLVLSIGTGGNARTY